MTPDPKLVEAVARAIWDCDAAGPIRVSAARLLAKEALAAITGEWWIAPWDRTDEMQDAFYKFEDIGSGEVWAAMRDAHLKETT